MMKDRRTKSSPCSSSSRRSPSPASCSIALLGLFVIPEGIETEAQLVKQTELGCLFGQGFRFSRAVEAAKIEQMLSTGMAVA